MEKMKTYRNGSWSFRFVSGEVRELRWNNLEIVRRVYAAVRDADWGTVPCRLESVAEQEMGDSLSLSFACRVEGHGIDYRWKGSIAAEGDGFSFAFHGRALTSFRACRIGLCVLHPMPQLSGLPVEVLHSNSNRTTTVFPVDPAPDRIFRDMVGLAYRIPPGLNVSLAFEGGIFEGEDQRNWSDASCKSYTPPLDDPYPIEIPAGTETIQKVRFRVEGSVPEIVDREPVFPRRIILDRLESRPLPSIGFCIPVAGDEPNEFMANAIRDLSPAFLYLELYPGSSKMESRFSNAANLSRRTGIPLRLGLVVGEYDRSVAKSFSQAIQRLSPKVLDAFILPDRGASKPEGIWFAWKEILKRFFPEIPVGWGTHRNFVELNRRPPPGGVTDRVCFAVSPQVHAEDDETLWESLSVQTILVLAARRFSNAPAVHVGPITLKPRPPISPTEENQTAGVAVAQWDSRSDTGFGALWFAASMAACTAGGATGVIWPDVYGALGLVRSRGSYAMVAPLWSTAKLLSEYAGGCIATFHTDKAGLSGFVLSRDAERSIVVMNLSDEPREIRLDPSDKYVQLHCITGKAGVVSLEEARASFFLRSAGRGEIAIGPWSQLWIKEDGECSALEIQ